MISQLYETSPGLLAVGVALSLATMVVFTFRLWGEFVGNVSMRSIGLNSKNGNKYHFTRLSLCGIIGS